MMLDIPFLWALIVGFALAMYIILDGFDLGIGILLLFTGEQEHRDLMVRSIAPLWDGNETWLVLVGVGLLGGFPAAYGILLPALYLPAFFMLMSLAFRGVSFEFRFQAGEGRRLWDYAFGLGSLGAAVSQGIALGALIHGVSVSNSSFNGGAMDFLSPLSLTCGLVLPIGYSYIGACWLAVKTTGPLSQRSRRQALILLALFPVGVIGVAVWAGSVQPLLHSALTTAAFPALLLNLIALLAATVISGWVLLSGREKFYFPSAIAVFVTVFGGFELSLYPYIVPFQLTIWHAASAEKSQAALLTAVALLLPVVLAYSAYSYNVFKGKVTTADLEDQEA